MTPSFMIGATVIASRFVRRDRPCKNITPVATNAIGPRMPGTMCLLGSVLMIYAKR